MKIPGSLFLMLLSACNNLCFSQQTDSFVLVKNTNIYYQVKGHGKPSIVFVSGLGDDNETWQTVQDSISKFSLTFSYDRSGLGKSGYHGEKKDLPSIAGELHELTAVIHIPKPFIIVGHSLGCQIAKEYAALYPADVKGIIFLDPGYNEEKLKAAITDSLWQEREKALKKYLPEFNAAQQAELQNANKSSAISDEIKALPKIPIVLFTATHINADFPASAIELKIKKETHDLWLRSLPWAKHIEVSSSRHYIQNDDPAVVITAIYGMITELRK